MNKWKERYESRDRYQSVGQVKKLQQLLGNFLKLALNVLIMKDRKIILISGCSSGIGKIASQNLSLKGNQVYAGIRNGEELKVLQQEWRKNYPELHPIKLDVTDKKECQSVVTKILSKEGRVDVLINIAGYTLVGPTDQFNSDDFIKILDTNVIGAFRLIKAVLPSMKEKRTGKIINITSLNGLIAFPNYGLYSASKFALEALGRSLHFELKSFNIWVTNIAPGAVKSTVTADTKILPHKSAREKFWLLKLLLPLVKDIQVVDVISEAVDQTRPPISIAVGLDVKIITLFQRFLPQYVWDRLMTKVWLG